MTGVSKFTIHHGVAASVALHATLAMPFVLYGAAFQPDAPTILVVELKGIIAENQAAEKVTEQAVTQARQETAAPERPAEAAPPPPAPPSPPPAPEPEPMETTHSETGLPAPQPPSIQAAPAPPVTSETRMATGGATNEPIEEAARQEARTIARASDESDRIREYVKLLTKKVQSNLVYPEEGRRAGLQGVATVSFTILEDGQIRPEMLKIVESSGNPKLDASALNTIRASAPFAPPPREMTLAIAVAFGRKAR